MVETAIVEGVGVMEVVAGEEETIEADLEAADIKVEVVGVGEEEVIKDEEALEVEVQCAAVDVVEVLGQGNF